MGFDINRVIIGVDDGTMPDRVIEKLQALQKLGLDKFILSGGWRNADTHEAVEAKQLLEIEVLTALR